MYHLEVADPDRSPVDDTPRLDRPVADVWCILGWCLSTAVFAGLIAVLGGPSLGDWEISGFSTWAIAHGQLRCAFPAGQVLAPPLYPLLAGGVAALAHIGHGPFPALGNCDNAFRVMYQWSVRANALRKTLAIGYLAWLALLAGAVSWLRASGRGRCGWEPVTLLVLACLPPVWMCVESVFHPQDLVAMGLALGAAACAHRGRWVGSGILVALAVLTQQFALLVAVPLLILAPGRQRVRYVVAAIGTAIVVAVPLLTASSGSVAHALAIGGGDNVGLGGTMLWHLHLQGTSLLLATRVPPVAGSAVLARWAQQRFGPASLEAIPLLSVLALSLSLRLVFEESLYAYYFMALAVALVLLDVARGHVRTSLVGWLVLVPTVFGVGHVLLDRQYVEDPSQRAIALLVLASGVLLMLGRAGGVRGRHAMLWIAVVMGAALLSPATNYPLGLHPPLWVLQVGLVGLGVALAAGPLLAVTYPIAVLRARI